MKVLLTFDPHNEAVVRSAKMIGELLRREGADVEAIDISQKTIDILAPYDKIVVGGEIWFGKFSSRVQEYMMRNQEEMLIKPVFMFVHAYVGGSNFQDQLLKSLPMEILTHANTFNFGMDVDLENLNPVDKIKWRLTRQQIEVPADTSQIKQLVEFILQ